MHKTSQPKVSEGSPPKAPSRSSRRLVVVPLYESWIENILVLDREDPLDMKTLNLGETAYKVFRRLHIKNLPKDAKIIGSFYDMASQAVSVVIQSKDFDEVPLGARIPILKHDIVEVLVKIPDPMVHSAQLIPRGDYEIPERLSRVVNWFKFTFTRTRSEDIVNEEFANEAGGDQAPAQSVDASRPG